MHLHSFSHSIVFIALRIDLLSAFDLTGGATIPIRGARWDSESGLGHARQIEQSFSVAVKGESEISEITKRACWWKGGVGLGISDGLFQPFGPSQGEVWNSGLHLPPLGSVGAWFCFCGPLSLRGRYPCQATNPCTAVAHQSPEASSPPLPYSISDLAD